MSTTTRTTTSGNTRRAPQRTCVACRRTGDQSSFIRLVRMSDENGSRIEVSEGRRRVAGRGAYLCREANCWERGLRGAIAGSLRTQLTTTNRDTLQAYAARFAPTPAPESDSGEREGRDT